MRTESDLMLLVGFQLEMLEETLANLGCKMDHMIIQNSGGQCIKYCLDEKGIWMFKRLANWTKHAEEPVAIDGRKSDTAIKTVDEYTSVIPGFPLQ